MAKSKLILLLRLRAYARDLPPKPPKGGLVCVEKKCPCGSCYSIIGAMFRDLFVDLLITYITTLIGPFGPCKVLDVKGVWGTAPGYTAKIDLWYSRPSRPAVSQDFSI